MVAAVMLGTWAPPVSAASRVGADLADGVQAGVTVDLDGDGAREIVAIVADDEGQDLVVWRETDAGWEAIGDARVTGSAAGGSGTGPLAATDGSGLVLANDGTRQRAILATIPLGGSSVVQCCLSLFDVVLASGEVRLTPIAQNLGLASSIESADLDADGRDELIVKSPIDPTGPEPPFEAVRILHWADGSLVEEAVGAPEDAGLLVAIGNSDGVPGDDLHFIARRVVTRLTAADAGLTAETGILPDSGTGLAGTWVVGATGGALVTLDENGRVTTLRWPRGEPLSATESVTTGPFASVFVLGEGPDARIVTMESVILTDQPMRSSVYDLDLALESQFVPGPAIEAMLEVTTTSDLGLDEDEFRPRPQFGPLGVPPGGGAALLVPGTLLVLGRDGELATGSAVPFAGAGAMGLAGADGAWVVSGLGWNSFSPTSAGLHGGTPGTHLAVVPLERLVGAATGREPDLDVEHGALVDGPDGPTVYFERAGLRIDVHAEAGARAFALAGSSTDVATVVDAPATLTLQPDVSPDREPPERAIVVVVEPGGLARVATWETVALNGSPDLRAASQSSSFRATSTVTGRVIGPATVTVDGTSVAVRPDGSFAIEVDAPIWGQEVRVTATDPLGHTSVELVTAIGFVDYRTLPWLPILGAITALIGLALFVRTPRSAAVHGPATAGDGRLEELDPDRS